MTGVLSISDKYRMQIFDAFLMQAMSFQKTKMFDVE